MDRQNIGENMKKPDKFLFESLNRLTKIELIKMILGFSDMSDEIKNQLYLKFTSGDDEVSVCNEVMQQCIDTSIKDGVINRNKVEYAASGGSQVLKKANEKAIQKDYVTAIELCIAVLAMYVPIISKSQDEDNFMCFLIDKCINNTKEYVIKISKSPNIDQRKSLVFFIIQQQVIKPIYNDWVDWRAELLEACTYLCDDEDIRISFYELMNKIINDSPDNHWSKVFVLKRLKEILYGVIEKYESRIFIDNFLENNMEYQKFREILLSKTLEDADYEKVIVLCNEINKLGINNSSNDWKHYLYKARKALGHVGEQRKLAEELVLFGHIEYYKELKKMYTEEEWVEESAVLIEVLSEENPVQPIYLEVLLYENKEREVFNYLKKRGNLRLFFSEELIKTYKDKMQKIINKYIYYLIKNYKSNSNSIDQLEFILDKYKNIYGDLSVQELVVQIKSQQVVNDIMKDFLEKIS